MATAALEDGNNDADAQKSFSNGNVCVSAERPPSPTLATLADRYQSSATVRDGHAAEHDWGTGCNEGDAASRWPAVLSPFPCCDPEACVPVCSSHAEGAQTAVSAESSGGEGRTATNHQAETQHFTAKGPLGDTSAPESEHRGLRELKECTTDYAAGKK